jgi:hypothetical protein
MFLSHVTIADDDGFAGANGANHPLSPCELSIADWRRAEDVATGTSGLCAPARRRYIDACRVPADGGVRITTRTDCRTSAPAAGDSARVVRDPDDDAIGSHETPQRLA